MLRNTAAQANCKTAFDIILAGPKIRGKERKLYAMSDGKDGDIYEVLLRALAAGEPTLSLTYQDIRSESQRWCQLTLRAVSISANR